jgi:hypothetical protein
MIEHTDNPDDVGANGLPPSAPADPAVASLEQRVRRLEETVAQLQDTRALEERISERLASRGRLDAVKDSAGMLFSAGKQLLPVAADVIRTETAAAATPRPSGAPPRPGWLLFDTLAEMRLTYYMFVDPRYRLSWLGRLVPILYAVAVVLVWVLLYGILTAPLSVLFGVLVMAPIQLVLTYPLLKVLSHEAQRYRDNAGPYPPGPRA